MRLLRDALRPSGPGQPLDPRLLSPSAPRPSPHRLGGWGGGPTVLGTGSPILYCSGGRTRAGSSGAFVD